MIKMEWEVVKFLFYLVILSYTVVAFVNACFLWRLRTQNGINKLIKGVALMEAGVFAMGALDLAANAFGQIVKGVPTVGFAATFWTGKFICFLTQWSFFVWLFLGRHKEH